MGEATALRKQQLDADRQAVKARVVRTRRRLAEDGDALKDEVGRLVGAESPMADHPRAVVAGSAAVGFVLGKTGAAAPSVDPGPGVRSAAKKGAGAVTDLLKVEAVRVAKDFLSGAFDVKPASRE